MLTLRATIARPGEWPKALHPDGLPLYFIDVGPAFDQLGLEDEVKEALPNRNAQRGFRLDC
jgi:hypothetical protein